MERIYITFKRGKQIVYKNVADSIVTDKFLIMKIDGDSVYVNVDEIYAMKIKKEKERNGGLNK